MYIMNESTNKGRNLVIMSIIVFLGFSIIDLITYALNVAKVGNQGLISQVFQVIIHLFLSYYLYKGRKGARLIVGIVLILDSVAYLFRIAEAVIASLPMTLFIIYIGFQFITKCISGILLLTSKNVREFLEFQSNKLKY